MERKELGPTEIQLFNGGSFDFANPDPADVNLRDIAFSLSHQCRFAGHCKYFYSVAHHSVLVSQKVPPEHALTALMHDATEAYVNDIPAPLKSLLPEYKEIEDSVWVAVATKFGLPLVMPDDVKMADQRMCVTEKEQILTEDYLWTEYDHIKPYEDITIQPLNIEGSFHMFMNRFAELY